MHILVTPLDADGRMLGAIGIIHDVAFIGTSVWRHALTSVAQTLLIVALTLLIVRWSLGRPLRHMAQWLRDRGLATPPPAASRPKKRSSSR